MPSHIWLQQRPVDPLILPALVVLASCLIVMVALMVRGAVPPGPAADLTHAAIGALTTRMENLERQANIDELTGLPNYRQLLQHDLPRALLEAESHQQPLTLAYLDVDGMKQLNDSSGHAFADQVLRSIAHAVVASLSVRRCTDRAYRHYKEGDELIILQPGAGATRGRENLEVVLDSIRALGRTASIGAVVVPPGWQGTPQDLINLADAAMRRAKKAGKDAIRLEVLQ